MRSVLAATDAAVLAAWAALITGTIGSMAAAVVSVIVAIRTKDVQKQVSTGNGQTIGEAVKETRDTVVSTPDA